MAQTKKIPATVITGFLGAGKTSTIQHLLKTAGGRKLALIINEFGDLGVDSDIVKGCNIEGCNDDDVLELANGCICCTVADDFIPTIEKLLNRETPPDHIIIETSGLALPKPLVKAFNWPEIRTRVTVDGVITLVDGRAVADGLFASNPQAIEAQRAADDNLDHESPLEELFEEQLACADMVVINKFDLLEEGDMDKVLAAVHKEIRPEVKIVKIAHGQIDASVLLGLEAAAEDDLDSRHSHHDDGHEHDHDDFESFAVEFGEINDPEALIAKLLPIVAKHEILRMKGFVAVAGKDMRLVIQGVGSRFQHYYDQEWSDTATRRSRLVVIGDHDMDEATIRAEITA
ncbi:cobalamin biosynthesis protein CobW [Kiloniella laminariae]|uniref:Cobalamin biosynthesis protein CobW n=1 Tax=Kiloniella laminariae TaxID=454162 RepID=A0ABT4LI10_9PROT|nr:cobalamin biosynthesis protein CobW [Kiloniella laminariae]MCZ4280733.1 cobalamin biosynthesis protein CobW [Kiloniella laminariae]